MHDRVFLLSPVRRHVRDEWDMWHA